MANTLANFKACVQPFEPKQYHVERINLEKQLKEWQENFECYLTFENLRYPQDGPSWNKLSAIAKLKICNKTLNITDKTYGIKNQDLTNHFSTKKNLELNASNSYAQSHWMPWRSTITESPDFGPTSKVVNSSKWMMTKLSNWSSHCKLVQTNYRQKSYKKIWTSPKWFQLSKLSSWLIEGCNISNAITSNLLIEITAT